MMMNYLPDINVWIALAFQSRSEHPVARNWYDSLESPTLLFCRLTQQGLLRLATNAKAIGSQACTLGKAWDLYDQLLVDYCAIYASEPVKLEHQWRTFTQGHTFSPKIWNDAYLAAFAVCNTLEVVTFDRGFRQFPGLHCTIL